MKYKFTKTFLFAEIKRNVELMGGVDADDFLNEMREKYRLNKESQGIGTRCFRPARL